MDYFRGSDLKPISPNDSGFTGKDVFDFTYAAANWRATLAQILLGYGLHPDVITAGVDLAVELEGQANGIRVTPSQRTIEVLGPKTDDARNNPRRTF